MAASITLFKCTRACALLFCFGLVATHGASAMPATDLAGARDPDVGNTGAYSFSIPIDAPVGTGSFQPSLALRYSSNGGDGAFGIGWRLAIGEIGRSTRFGTPAYDAADPFELDGELLVENTSSGKYHTIRESNVRAALVSQTGDLDYWEVTFPNGTIGRYGITTNARVDHATVAASYRWLLEELEDVHGNQIQFAYDASDTGTRYPASITYSYRNGVLVGGVERRIEFLIEPRPDPAVSYRGGVRQEMNQRISEIVSTVDGAAFRRRVLEYDTTGYSTGRSRITASQLFGDDCSPTPPAATQTACAGQGLPRETYEYRDPSDVLPATVSAQWSAPSTTWNLPVPFATAGSTGAGRDNGVRIGDVNGDGRADLVQAVRSSSGTVISKVFIANGAGWSEDTTWSTALGSLAFDSNLMQLSCGVPTYPPHSARPVVFADYVDWLQPVGGAYAPPIRAELADIDSDGHADILISIAMGAGSYFACGSSSVVVEHDGAFVRKVFMNNGSTWVEDASAAAGLPPFYQIADLSNRPNFTPLSFDTNSPRFVDVNGDQLVDVAVGGIGEMLPGGAQGALGTWINQGGTGWVEDPSYLPPHRFNDILSSSHSGTPAFQGLDSHDTGVKFVDLNADGLVDIAKLGTQGSTTITSDHAIEATYLNTGTGWCDPLTECASENAHFAYPEGYADLVLPGGAYILTPKAVQIVDLNGDGYPEFLRADAVIYTRLNDPSGATAWAGSSDEFRPPVSTHGTSGAFLVGYGVRLVDVDSDGAPDWVQSYDDFGTALESQYASNALFPDRLSRASNGSGGSVDVEYVSPLAQQDNAPGGLEEIASLHAAELAIGEGPGTDGSIAQWNAATAVVSSITQSSLDSSYTFDLRYAAPRWCPTYRSRLGFRVVERERPDGSVERRYHWQHHGRAGQLAKLEVLDVGGAAVAEATYAWDALDGASVPWSAPGAFVGRITSAVSANLYAGAKGAESTTSLTYDDVDVGDNFVTEVSQTRPTGTLVVQRTRFVDPANASLVGLVDRETRRADSGTGTILSRVNYSYVSNRGLVNAVIALARDRDDSQGLTVEISLLGYDIYGNLVSTTDPVGNTTRLCWDGDTTGGCPGSATATFSVSAGAVEPAPFSGVTAVAADLSTGAPLSVVGFNGDVTVVSRDAFTRPTGQTFTPSGGSAITLGSTTYFDGPGQPYVEECTRVESGGTDEICRRAYDDGLGRVSRSTQDVGSDSSGAILFAGSAQTFDYAGRPIRQTLPTACGADASCAAIDPNRTDRVVLNAYDPLGRTLSSVVQRTSTIQEKQAFYYGRTARSEPVGGASLALDLVLAKDADGILTRRLVDGGRLAWVDECTVTVASSLGTLTGNECSSADETYYSYESTGELATIYDATGLVTQAMHRISYRYDTAGRVRFIDDPDGGTREVLYYANGQVHQSVNARLQTTTYTYDSLGRIGTAASPERTINVLYDHPGTRAPSREEVIGEYSIDFGYDDLGRTSSQTLTVSGVPSGMGSAAKLDMTFDLLGRPTLIDYPTTDTRVAYSYSGPNLKSACAVTASGLCNSSARTYLMDATYDGLGRVDQLTILPGALDNSYDAVTDRLTRTQLTGGGVIDMTYAYTPAGRVDSITDGVASGLESASASFAYDARGRLDNWTRTAPVTPETFHFSYDVLGNLTGRDLASASGAANQLYAGTRPHALTSRTVGAQTLQYEYDADGNLTRRDREGALTHYLGWNSAGQLTCIWTASGCDVAQFGYDLAGNRIYERTPGGGFVFHIGELATTSSDGTAEVRIWALGRQLAVEEITGAQLRGDPVLLVPGWPRWLLPWLLVLLAAGALAGLAFAIHRLQVIPGLLEHPIAGPLALAVSVTLVVLPAPAFAGGGGGGPVHAVRWIFANHLGTGVVYTSQYRAVVRRRVFEPFGRVIHEDTGGTEDPTTVFTGKRLHEDVGLYYFGARWMDAEAGRFVSVDPIVPSPEDPQSFNGYSYVRNDPVNRVDLDGRYDIDCAKIPGCSVVYDSRGGGGLKAGDITKNGSLVLNPGDVVPDGVTNIVVLSGSGAGGASPDFSNLDGFGGLDAAGGGGFGVLDAIQIGLGVLGTAPVVGNVADLVNAGISALRGDFAGAALDLASAIPGAGQAVAPLAIARRTAIAARAGSNFGAKILKQLGPRGFTRQSVEATIQKPNRTVLTRDVRHLPGGGRMNDPATAFINSDGSFVVRNDRTGDIVQISNRNDPGFKSPF